PPGAAYIHCGFALVRWEKASYTGRERDESQAYRHVTERSDRTARPFGGSCAPPPRGRAVFVGRRDEGKRRVSRVPGVGARVSGVVKVKSRFRHPTPDTRYPPRPTPDTRYPTPSPCHPIT